MLKLLTYSRIYEGHEDEPEERVCIYDDESWSDDEIAACLTGKHKGPFEGSEILDIPAENLPFLGKVGAALLNGLAKQKRETEEDEKTFPKDRYLS